MWRLVLASLLSKCSQVCSNRQGFAPASTSSSVSSTEQRKFVQCSVHPFLLLMYSVFCVMLARVWSRYNKWWLHYKGRWGAGAGMSDRTIENYTRTRKRIINNFPFLFWISGRRAAAGRGTDDVDSLTAADHTDHRIHNIQSTGTELNSETQKCWNAPRTMQNIAK